MSDVNEKDPQLKPRMDFKYFIMQICNIKKIPIEGEDITSQRFGESVITHLREEQRKQKKLRKLIESFYNATIQPLDEKDGELQLTCQPNNSNATLSSETPRNETDEILMDSGSAHRELDTMPASFEALTPTVLTETDTTQNDKNVYAETATTIKKSLKVEMRDSQSPISSLTGTAERQDTNETKVRDSIEVDGTLNNQLRESTQPTSSRKIPAQGAGKRRVPKKKIHAVHDLGDGKYRCLCGSKFKSKEIQKHHIKHFNSVWKFKCDQCSKRFFQLSGLKLHLNKQHGMKKPLNVYVCGCTQCGEKFETRTKFEKHLKEKHNVQKKSRRQRKTPRRSETSAGQALMTPGQRQLSLRTRNSVSILPQDLDEQGHNTDMTNGVTPSSSQSCGQCEVIDIISSDDEQDIQVILPEPPSSRKQVGDNHSISRMNDLEQLDIVEIKPRESVKDYRYSCAICDQAFISFLGSNTNMSKHMARKHEGVRMGVKCDICHHVFDLCKSFDLHWNSSCNRQVNGDSMEKEQFEGPVVGVENYSVEFSAGLNVSHHRHHDYGNSYGCEICSQVFGDVKQLRRHETERHPKKPQRNVKCGFCGMVCASLKVFHAHRAKYHHVKL